MTIPEEIEQLKTRLEQTAGEREQAEILSALLNKLANLNSTDSQIYIDRLMQLAEKINEPIYKAWGLYHLAVLNRLYGEFAVSSDLNTQAIQLFKENGRVQGIAYCYINTGLINNKRVNYDESIKNYSAALKIFEETGDATGITYCYNYLGNAYCNMGNYSEAIKYHSNSLKAAEALGDRFCIATSLNNTGIIHHLLGNYADALKHFKPALKLRKEIVHKRGIAGTYNCMANVYEYQGNYPEALKNQRASLKYNEEIGDMTGVANSYNNLGNGYHYLGNYKEALKNYLAALEIFERYQDIQGVAYCYGNIGVMHDKLGNFPEALKNHFAALNLFEQASSKPGIAATYDNIGNVYEKQGDYSSALKNHQVALKIAEEIGDKQGIAFACTNLGNVYAKQHNYIDALKSQLSALQIAEDIKNKELIKDSSLSISHIYKATGNFESALSYYAKYHQVENEMVGEQTQKQLTNLHFQHNMEQKEKDLEIEQLRNVELKKERDRSEALLLNILPGEVAEELKNKGSAAAKLFDDVTVLFTDFKGFTNVSERLTPQQLVDELHTCFSAFDEIISKHNIEKIKTVGDAYLAVSGLPLAQAGHAANVINAAIEIREFIKERVKHKGNETFDVRIGVHSGSVVAGIVGVKKYAYDVWGDTVNIAARMEQNSEAGKINISETTYHLVKDKFSCSYRGEIEAKNKGKMKMYFVER